MIVPSVARPEIRPGTAERTNATPPVDVVEAYQAKVKCLRRSRREIFSDLLSLSSSSMEESSTSFSASICLSGTLQSFGEGRCISPEICRYTIVESAKTVAVCRCLLLNAPKKLFKDFLIREIDYGPATVTQPALSESI